MAVNGAAASMPGPGSFLPYRPTDGHDVFLPFPYDPPVVAFPTRWGEGPVVGASRVRRGAARKVSWATPWGCEEEQMKGGVGANDGSAVCRRVYVLMRVWPSRAWAHPPART